MTVPYTFGSATAPIPLSQLDSNFATAITLGNTSIQLGNTVTTLNNMTLANVTISSGTSNIAVTSIANGTSNVTIASSGGAVNIATNGTTALTIDTSQNVGIGTSSPSNAKLNSIGADTAPQLNLYSNSSGSLGANFTYKTSSGDLYMATNGYNSSSAPQMVLSASGNLLVGTTSQLLGTSAKTNISFDNNTSYAMVIKAQSSGSFGAIYFVNSAGTIQGSITANGSGTTTYGTSSDYRLKENIAPMTGALAKVAQLKPVTYKWKIDGSNGEGFIAHELASIVSDCVVGEKDAVNEDGSINPQQVDTSFLVATLTAAIQEQQALIQTLQTQVAQLQEKVGV